MGMPSTGFRDAETGIQLLLDQGNMLRTWIQTAIAFYEVVFKPVRKNPQSLPGRTACGKSGLNSAHIALRKNDASTAPL
jgi:hypothetical protein